MTDVSVWDNPRNIGTPVIIGDETVYVGIFVGYEYAIMKEDLTKREFIKGGDIIFLFTMQGRFCEVLSESNFILNKLGRIRITSIQIWDLQLLENICLQIQKTLS